MQSRLSALLIAVAAVAWLGACEDRSPFAARFVNELAIRNVYAMNGTPPSLPSAVSLRGRQRVSEVVRIDPSWVFDVAFDMDSFGFVKVYSVKSVASELAQVNRVGFAIDSVHSFDQITEAPTSGYVYDTSMVLGVGRTLLVDVFDQSCVGQSFIGYNIRAKILVDSVTVANRGIYFRILTNPNCGFRSFLPGLPKN
jgi:hypothetical protein